MYDSQVRTAKNIYEKETAKLFEEVMIYFCTHMSIKKNFKMPTSNARFFAEFVTLVVNKKCGLKVERVSWSRYKIRVTISDPFEFYAYFK